LQNRRTGQLLGLRVAVIGANHIERDGLIGELAHTHPELTAIAFASVSECVGCSADPDVIMLRVSQDTSAQMALQDIEQLRSAFPGVPVMAITSMTDMNVVKMQRQEGTGADLV
jgi:hypothetical protein